jgi:hypothetical protein
MKVDAIRRSYYSAKNNVRNLSVQRQNRPYSHEEMLNMPRTQVWEEIKNIAAVILSKMAR